MNLDADLERLADQERRLWLPAFDEEAAWQLGSELREAARQRGAAVTIEIRLAGHTVFLHAMPGTTAVNADWARRKRNTVELLQQSSYRIGLQLQRDGTTLEAKLGLALRDNASAGGAVPLRVRGVGVVGVVTVSGLPQREDHAMVVAALAPRCGVPLAEIALD